jgi:hypothetical protein
MRYLLIVKLQSSYSHDLSKNYEFEEYFDAPTLDMAVVIAKAINWLWQGDPNGIAHPIFYAATTPLPKIFCWRALACPLAWRIAVKAPEIC